MASAMPFEKATVHDALRARPADAAASRRLAGDDRKRWSARRSMTFAVVSSSSLWAALVWAGVNLVQAQG